MDVFNDGVASMRTIDIARLSPEYKKYSEALIAADQANEHPTLGKNGKIDSLKETIVAAQKISENHDLKFNGSTYEEAKAYLLQLNLFNQLIFPKVEAIVYPPVCSGDAVFSLDESKNIVSRQSGAGCAAPICSGIRVPSIKLKVNLPKSSSER